MAFNIWTTCCLWPTGTYCRRERRTGIPPIRRMSLLASWFDDSCTRHHTMFHSSFTLSLCSKLKEKPYNIQQKFYNVVASNWKIKQTMFNSRFTLLLCSKLKEKAHTMFHSNFTMSLCSKLKEKPHIVPQQIHIAKKMTKKKWQVCVPEQQCNAIICFNHLSRLGVCTQQS